MPGQKCLDTSKKQMATVQWYTNQDPKGKKSPKGKESSLEENITPKPEEKFTDVFFLL